MCQDDDIGVHGASHPHAQGPRGDDDDEPQSTGFLPLSLAVALFVTGLFVLGIVPSSCS